MGLNQAAPNKLTQSVVANKKVSNGACKTFA